MCVFYTKKGLPYIEGSPLSDEKGILYFPELTLYGTAISGRFASGAFLLWATIFGGGPGSLVNGLTYLLQGRRELLAGAVY